MTMRSARSPLLPANSAPILASARDRFDQRVLDGMLDLLNRVEVGACTVDLPDGSRRMFGRPSGTCQAALRVNRFGAARRLFLGGEIGFAEAYMDGDWQSPDLATFLEFALRNEQSMGTTALGHVFRRVFARLHHIARRNSRDGSRRNIAHHYDLSNRFYRAWLGADMTYSSAMFASEADLSLAEAQRKKYLNLAGLLDLQPREHVLEIGCGWGGFALLAARDFGCRVTAVTLSEKQRAWTSRLIEEHGLTDRVEVRLEDYRDIRGRYDKIASIEMFEAVGEAYWPLYFRTLRERLKPGGAAALQVITIDAARFMTYRRRTDFIQRYIFPGGMLPTPDILRQQAAQASLVQSGLVAFGACYARTLRMWNESFQQAWPVIAALGFDQRFKRMWEYYLAYCEAGFRVGSIDVVQFRLKHS